MFLNNQESFIQPTCLCKIHLANIRRKILLEILEEKNLETNPGRKFNNSYNYVN